MTDHLDQERARLVAKMREELLVQKALTDMLERAVSDMAHVRAEFHKALEKMGK